MYACTYVRTYVPDWLGDDVKLLKVGSHGKGLSASSAQIVSLCLQHSDGRCTDNSA